MGVDIEYAGRAVKVIVVRPDWTSEHYRVPSDNLNATAMVSIDVISGRDHIYADNYNSLKDAIGRVGLSKIPNMADHDIGYIADVLRDLFVVLSDDNSLPHNYRSVGDLLTSISHAMALREIKKREASR